MECNHDQPQMRYITEIDCTYNSLKLKEDESQDLGAHWKRARHGPMNPMKGRSI